MKTRISFYKFAFFMAAFAPTAAWAAHPLITDDAGTLGKGNFQFELNGQYDHEEEDGITAKESQIATALSYGITDDIDFAVGIPFLWTKEESTLLDSSESGFSDASLDVKLRFYEKDGLSFAVKPGLSIPTGDDEKGLGAGKVGYHLYLIGTKEAGPWTFMGNLGYIRNETDADTEEKNIWHISVAAAYALDDHWKIVADAGAERNPDIDGDNDPVYALAGVVYSPTEDIDLDLGMKAGLTSSETDWSLMAGTTFRF